LRRYEYPSLKEVGLGGADFMNRDGAGKAARLFSILLKTDNGRSSFRNSFFKVIEYTLCSLCYKETLAVEYRVTAWKQATEFDG